MSGEAQTIWRHGRLYAVGSLLTRIGNFLLIPLYARLLSPDEFGTYALIVVALEFLAVVLGLELGNAMARSFFGFEDERNRRAVISTCLLACSAVAIVLSATSYVMASGIGYLLFTSHDLDGVISLAVIGLALTILYNIQVGYFRIRKKSGTFVLISAAKLALLIATNLLFVLLLDYGVKGIFLSAALSVGVVALALQVVILRDVGTAFSFAILKDVMLMGAPFLPAAVMDSALRVLERYILNIFLWTGAVGVYALGGRLAQALHLFLTAPFSQIWAVRRLESFKAETQATAMADVFLYFIALITIAALALSMFAPELMQILTTPDYYAAIQCIPFLSMSFVLIAVRLNWDIKIVEEKKTIYFPVISGVTLAVGATMTLLLIWQFGLVGAAVANMMTELCSLAVTILISRRKFSTQPSVAAAKIVFLISSAILVYILSAVIAGFNADVVVTVVAKTLLLFSFAGAVLFSPVVSPPDRAMLLMATTGLLYRYRAFVIPRNWLTVSRARRKPVRSL